MSSNSFPYGAHSNGFPSSFGPSPFGQVTSPSPFHFGTPAAPSLFGTPTVSSTSFAGSLFQPYKSCELCKQEDRINNMKQKDNKHYCERCFYFHLKSENKKELVNVLKDILHEMRRNKDIEVHNEVMSHTKDIDTLNAYLKNGTTNV